MPTHISFNKRVLLRLSGLFAAIGMGGLVLLSGCGGKGRSAETGGKMKLVLISPHNENIQQEFGQAFSAWHLTEHGTEVQLEWRDVGGGTNAIVQYLRNVYSRAETSEIDILWGGGEQVFTALASEGVFEPIMLEQPAAVLAEIPEQFGGIGLRDSELLWCGSALSGFGFLYNRQLLQMRGLPPPARWEDLADDRMFGLVALADPTQSGSAAAAYEMIVQSAETWPQGWTKLLMVLGNANRFYDSAGDAANAPGLGEAMVATCIDFYGAVRVAGAPDVLVYVSPVGQTAFTPDPIAVLKNPPHAELAHRFANFVLSRQGQALWAVRPGEPAGPERYALGRQPIRRDIYTDYGDKLSAWIANPYTEGHEMALDMEMKMLRAEALKHLVRCAAIDNLDEMRAARKAVMGKNPDSKEVEAFGKLPPEAMTKEGLADLADRLRDPAAAERIIASWQAFFRSNFKAIGR